jgi:hypothetical protein
MRTFSFFIHHVGSSTPTLMFEFAGDAATLQSLAQKALADSPGHLAIEIREADRLVFSLDRNGETWPGRRSMLPDRQISEFGHPLNCSLVHG